jgi:protein ImuB
MQRRYVAVWFQYLTSDWVVRRQPHLKECAFVLATPEKGRMVIKAVSKTAHTNGINKGMVVADSRAILPTLQVLHYQPDTATKLLNGLAEWCLRFTPVAAIDPPDGLILEATGCPHLWGGELPYLQDITKRLSGFGYHVRVAMADTIGAAWAVCRYAPATLVVPTGENLTTLLPLPPDALRLPLATIDRLEKLGLRQIRNIVTMPKAALRRRFGDVLIERLHQAIGTAPETLQPIQPIEPYQERLPCLEPIRTANGIAIALQMLLDTLCARLKKEAKGLRTALLVCYRIDGNQQQITINTSRTSNSAAHIFKLLELKIASLTPALGFELFLLSAPVVEDMTTQQDALWNTKHQHNEVAIAELLDRIAIKTGAQNIHRYLPNEHYWPEHCQKETADLQEKPSTHWRKDLPRPMHLLPKPEPIEVTVPIPDYPPMLFHYKGQLHNVTKADGPERIEQEWWLQDGQYRDYYCVEDEHGARYWLFRLGHYNSDAPNWFIHGFFA